MRKVRYRTLNLLMALLATMTFNLRARALVCGGFPTGSQSLAAEQTGFDSGALPIPAHKPLCHLRCRGFVASVPDAPQQPHAGATAPLEILAAYPAPALSAVAMNLNVISPPGASPPRYAVLRL